jgi:hypothetical protein
MDNNPKYIGDSKSFDEVLKSIKAELSKLPKKKKVKLEEVLPEPKNVRKVRIYGQSNSHLFDADTVRKHLFGGEDKKIR